MLEPIDLGTTVMREALKRSAVNPELIRSSVVGNCIPTEADLRMWLELFRLMQALPIILPH